MVVEIKVPVMGESVTEATVSVLLVHSGDRVVAGQEILELETDKVNQVVYAPESGQAEISVAVGDVVKIGDRLGSIVPAQNPVKPIVVEKAPEEKAQPTTPVIPATTLESGVTRAKMTGLRKTIATRLVEVKNQTAMLTTFNEVDMTAIMDIRKKEKEKFEEKHKVKLGFMSFFVKAATAALKAYPIINSYLDGDEICTPHSQDIGVAVSTDRGLIVPVIRSCDQKTFKDVEQEIAEQAKKARDGVIAIEDLKGGTFTITNGGVFGSLLSTPILNPPQSAILGMHSIVKRPVAIEDAIVIRPMMYVALSYDHRIIDGREAVLFLVHLKQSLEDPSRLLLDL